MLQTFSKLELSKRIFIGVGSLLIFIILFKFTSNLNMIPTTCPFKLLTGLPCPGCGLTRSVGYLTLGEFRLSFAHNPLGSLFIIYSITFVLFPKYLLSFPKKINEFLKKKNKSIQALIFVAPLLTLWLWNITRWSYYLY